MAYELAKFNKEEVQQRSVTKVEFLIYIENALIEEKMIEEDCNTIENSEDSFTNNSSFDINNFDIRAYDPRNT